MAMSLGFVVGILGVVILSHSASSTVQYRGLLKIMEEEFSGPPLTVVAELLLGLVFCMWAALTVPGTFLSIHPHSEENRIVSLPDNLDFMIQPSCQSVSRGVGFEVQTLRYFQSSKLGVGCIRPKHRRFQFLGL